MTRLLIIALLSLATADALAQGSVEAGQRKSQVCQACHGPDGNGIGDPQYPLLAGQHADYLAKALRDYRSGTRPNAIMAGFSTALSDQDIEDLAAYFAAQSGPLSTLDGQN
ncbi:MAG TPA: cytochrome C [Xanthomonadales bacterium]|nr:cytochrome C [Xanthomonadales bacterium]